MRHKLKSIAERYGYDAQSRQLIEEMAELTQAINKFWRKRAGKELIPNNTQELLFMPSEIADVYIMLWQVRYLMHIDDAELLRDIDYKLDRTIKRMQNHD